MIKRAVDILLSVLALAALAPLFVCIALAVKLGDFGPIFFRQVRIGLRGRPFHILKFRTMTTKQTGSQLAITAQGDPRITPIGKHLRRLKFDELPQLINVLRGEMSLVGPRPEVPKYVELYTHDQRRVLNLKPGITDEASLAFRDEEAMLAAAPDPERYYIEHCIPTKIALNLAYAERATPLTDLRLLGRTISHLWIRR